VTQDIEMDWIVPPQSQTEQEMEDEDSDFR
jgi:hypothetical protein